MDPKKAIEEIEFNSNLLNAEIQFMSDEDRETYDLGRAAMIAEIMADIAKVIVESGIEFEDVMIILGKYAAEGLEIAQKYGDEL